MKYRHSLESRIARAVAAVTVVVVLGLVAVMSEPPRMAWEGIDAAVLATTDAAPAAPAPASSDYFPSQYPAPTNVAEPMPTF
jgi:hypothetical protein